jgi:hypothetical protein
MKRADGIAHSYAPVSERSEAGQVAIGSRRTALAGTNRFEGFDGLGVHAFDPYLSEMGLEAFGGNSVSLVRPWFDVATCPRQEPVECVIKFEFFAGFNMLFWIPKAFHAVGCFQPQCLGLVGRLGASSVALAVGLELVMVKTSTFVDHLRLRSGGTSTLHLRM